MDPTGVPGSYSAAATYYAYDQDGVRIGRLTGAAATAYVVDKNRDLPQVLEERDGSGNLKVRYLYGHDLLAQVRPGGGGSPDYWYYHYDGQLSTRALTDDNPVPAQVAVTDRYAYDAFGEQLGHAGLPAGAGGGPAENAYQYTGEQRDGPTGFYYLRARYYDPATGRFASRDPFGGFNADPMSLHKYLYANADPVNRVDPGGKWSNYITVIAATAIMVNLAATIYNGVRHGKSVWGILTDVGMNLAIFGLIALSMFAAPAVAIGATVILVLAGLYGLYELVENWHRLDATDKTVAIIVLLTYAVFGITLRAGAPPKPVSSPLPESYFGKGRAVDMRPAPADSTTAKGFPRNLRWFWKKWFEKYPETLDESNQARVSNGRSPVVNREWIKHYPEHAKFEGDTLHHHHVDQGPWAVPLPETVHRGWSGLLHRLGRVSRWSAPDE